MLLSVADRERPVHVGTLLGNTPDMLNQMAAAGLGGYVLCGINTTRAARVCCQTYAGPTAKF